MSHRIFAALLALVFLAGASSPAFAGSKPHVKKPVKVKKEKKRHLHRHHRPR